MRTLALYGFVLSICVLCAWLEFERLVCWARQASLALCLCDLLSLCGSGRSTVDRFLGTLE